jgi:hypothetical protein
MLHVMVKVINRMGVQFIYLDGAAEREQLTTQIHAVRDDVAALAAQIPAVHHYEPRYNDLSLAVMLARLQAFDTGALWVVKAASNGYTVRLNRRFVRRLDALVSWLFKRRLVDVTLAGIRRKEAEICAFVEDVPMDVLSRRVIHPGRREPYTVEKALQVYFVHHWKRQHNLMQRVDGMVDKP